MWGCIPRYLCRPQHVICTRDTDDLASVNIRRYMDYFEDVCSSRGERFQSLCLTPYGAHLASLVFTKHVGYLEEAIRLVRRHRCSRLQPAPAAAASVSRDASINAATSDSVGAAVGSGSLGGLHGDESTAAASVMGGRRAGQADIGGQNTGQGDVGGGTVARGSTGWNTGASGGVYYGIKVGGDGGGLTAGRPGLNAGRPARDPYESLLEECRKQAPQRDTLMAIPEAMHALVRDLILAVIASDKEKEQERDKGKDEDKGGEREREGDRGKWGEREKQKSEGDDTGRNKEREKEELGGVDAVGKASMTCGSVDDIITQRDTHSGPSRCDVGNGDIVDSKAVGNTGAPAVTTSGNTGGGPDAGKCPIPDIRPTSGAGPILRDVNRHHPDHTSVRNTGRAHAATATNDKHGHRERAGPSPPDAVRSSGGLGRPMAAQAPPIGRKFLVFLPTYRDLERQHALLSSVTVSGGPLEVHVLHSSVDIAACLAVIERGASAHHPAQTAAAAATTSKASPSCASVQPVTDDGTATATKSASSPPPPAAVIILATNIAESSVTVEGVNCVVDLCRTLQVRWHVSQGRHLPCVVPASLSQIDQRAGRTGRTCDGEVFRLIPRAHKALLPREETPATELLSLWLQSLTLISGKDARVADPHYVFSKCLNPPDPWVIDCALQVLTDICAIVPRASHSSHHHHAATTVVTGSLGQRYQPPPRLVGSGVNVLLGGGPGMLGEGNGTQAMGGGGAGGLSARLAPPSVRYEPTPYGLLLASMPVSLEASLLAVEAGRRGLMREGAILAGLLSAKAYPILRPFGDAERYRRTLAQMGMPPHVGPDDDAYVLLLNLVSVLFWEREWRDARRWRRLGFGGGKPTGREAYWAGAGHGVAEGQQVEEDDGVGGYLHGGGGEEGAWCRRHGLIPSSLHAVQETADIIVEAIHRARPDFLPLSYRTGPPAYFGSGEPVHHPSCRCLAVGGAWDASPAPHDVCPGTGLEGGGLPWYTKEDADFLYSLVVAAVSSEIVAHMAKRSAPHNKPNPMSRGSTCPNGQPSHMAKGSACKASQGSSCPSDAPVHKHMSQVSAANGKAKFDGQNNCPHDKRTTNLPRAEGAPPGGASSSAIPPRPRDGRTQLEAVTSREGADHSKGEGGDDPGGPPLCTFFQRGRCNRGEACAFRHVAAPAIAACPAHESGQGCPRGRGCPRSHANWASLPWSPPSFPELAVVPEPPAHVGPSGKHAGQRGPQEGPGVPCKDASHTILHPPGTQGAAVAAEVVGCDGRSPLLDCPSPGGFVLVVGDDDLSFGEGMALAILRSPNFHVQRMGHMDQRQSQSAASPLRQCSNTSAGLPTSNSNQSSNPMAMVGQAHGIPGGEASVLHTTNAVSGMAMDNLGGSTNPAIVLSSPLTEEGLRQRFGGEVSARLRRLAPFRPSLQAVTSLDPTQLPDAWVFKTSSSSSSSSREESGWAVGLCPSSSFPFREDGAGASDLSSSFREDGTDGSGCGEAGPFGVRPYSGRYSSRGSNYGFNGYNNGPCQGGHPRRDAGVCVSMAHCCRIVWAFPRGIVTDAVSKDRHVSRLAAFFRAAAAAGLKERLRPPCFVGMPGGSDYDHYVGQYPAGMPPLSSVPSVKGAVYGPTSREVVLVLCNDRFSHWKVESIARECFFFLRGYWPFHAAHLPGYIPWWEAQDSKSQAMDKPTVYCFRLCLPPMERFGGYV
eukprot:jgi/Mesvir1/11798/Mv00159-RA.2